MRQAPRCLRERRVGSHQIREEAFVRLAQLGERHLMVAARQFEDDAVLDRAADRIDRHVGAARGVEEVGEAGVADGDQIQPLILAEKALGDAEGLFFARSEEHTSELQSLMRISYAVFCLKKKKKTQL